MMNTRRDLFRFFGATAGCYIVQSLSVSSGAGFFKQNFASTYSFPQGVASADPQSDAMVLWTRVEGDSDAVELQVEVSSDDAFANIVARSTVSAYAEYDHTVRVLVTDLEPDTYYFYRFVSPDGGISRTGRTKTAPAADSFRHLNIAVFSCQDYEQGYFTAYRRLITDDAATPPHRRIDLVMHVGDFIYESIRGPNTRSETDLNGNEIELYNSDGSLRRCSPFPSGGVVAGRGWIQPKNVDDYRHLYKRYLSDPDLQEARALYPFVQTWDDHELLNDYWQSYYKDKSIADLKVASNQAWFEYVPAALSHGGRSGREHHAKDFSAAAVFRVPPNYFDDSYLSQEPNNLAAIDTLTIYRSLSWGKMAELFLVDGRSYRGPRGLPQELLTIGRHPYPEAPVDPALILTMNAGRTANDDNPPREVEYSGQIIDNPRRDKPAASMLGAKQKKWLKAGLRNSAAKWKILGLNVGMMRHGFDDSFRDDGDVNRILWTDGWDGYPVERNELTKFVKDNEITNVVSLTGDRHAHMAGVVYDDFDIKKPAAIFPEFAGGAVSAPNRLIIQKVLMAHDHELSKLTSFNGKKFGYSQKIMPSLNAWILHGAKSAQTVYENGNANQIPETSDSRVNPHLSYVDSDAYGFFIARLTGNSCDVDFVVVNEPVAAAHPANASIRRRLSFKIDSWNKGEEPVLQMTASEGPPPLGGLKV